MKYLIVALIMCAATAACGKAGSSPAPSADHAIASPVIGAYDTLREALASDSLKLAQTAAKSLAMVASKYDGLAAAAKKAGEGATIEDVRMAFGETSKALLEVIKTEPALGEGLIAYRCPMAEGYQKWVQVGPPMRNPYMGSKMLECGSKADLTP